MKKLLSVLSVVLLLGFTTAQKANPKTETATSKTEKNKTVATAKKEGVKLKKDGTPDKRYKANKSLKKDGTPDKRYKENK